MPNSYNVKIPFKRKVSMISVWLWDRVSAQIKSVAFVVIYLTLAQLFLLRQTIVSAVSVALGIGATIIGLALFLEGLFLGVMPLGERCGLKLPQKANFLTISIFSVVLGIAATYAEPAIGIIKMQGSSTTPWDTPLLYLLLNRGSSWLVLSIAFGVGLAVLLGMFRFLRKWPLKPFIFIIIPILIAASFLCLFDKNLSSVLGLAWDTGGVTTGPVTVPLVISLGIGISRIVGTKDNSSGGLGVVTLASAIPVAAVLILSCALLPKVLEPSSPMVFFSNENRTKALYVVGSEAELVKIAKQACDEGKLSKTHFNEFFPEYTENSENTPKTAEETSTEQGLNPLLSSGLGAMKAVLPLALVLIFTLVFLLKDKLQNADEIFLGLVFAVVGLFLFNFGMENGLSELGRQTGTSLPLAYQGKENPNRAVVLKAVTENDIINVASESGSKKYILMESENGPQAIPFDYKNWDKDTSTYKYVPYLQAIFITWGKYAGLIIALAFVFILGFGATFAEPSLAALGITIEELTTGTYKKKTLVTMVAIGVGLGLAFGFASILFNLPLIWILSIPYALALFLTIFSNEDFAAIAWDCAGVTTGPVTVPLVIATALGMGAQSGVGASFGVVASASVFPIVTVLFSGVWTKLTAKSLSSSWVTEEAK